MNKVKTQEEFKREFMQLKPPFSVKYALLSNGEKLGYMETGQGQDTIILIHGHFNSSLNMVPYMKKLSKNMRCIAVCQRGYGYSSYNKKVTDLKDFAQDLKLFVNDHLGLDNFYVLGHSNGGVTAIYLQNLLPSKVKGILQVSAISPTGSQYGWGKLLENGTKRHQEKAQEMLENSDFEYFQNEFITWFYKKAPKLTQEQIEYSFKIASRMRTHDIIAKLNSELNLEKEIKNMKCPMLLLHGTEDPMFPFENTIDYKQLNNTKLEAVGLVGAGHIPSSTHLDQIETSVNTFVEKWSQSKEWQSELEKLKLANKVSNIKPVISQKIMDSLKDIGSEYFRPVFRGSLIRESIQDMLQFNSNTTFQPIFT